MNAIWMCICVAMWLQGYLIGRLLRRAAAVKRPVVDEGILDIAFQLQDQAADIDKVLVLIELKNGKSTSRDNGLKHDEAREMANTWLERCLYQDNPEGESNGYSSEHR